MSLDNFRRATKRGLTRLGRNATVINQNAQTTGGTPDRDKHGNLNWSTETNSVTDVQVTYRGSPSFDRRADGIDADVDMIAWVDDTETVTPGDQNESIRATRIEVNDERYVVRDVFNETGVVRAHGTKEDNVR